MAFSVTDKLKQLFADRFPAPGSEAQPEPTAPANLVPIETTPLTKTQESFVAALQPGQNVKLPAPDDLRKYAQLCGIDARFMAVSVEQRRATSIPVPSQPGLYYVPELQRTMQVDNTTEVKLRLPLLLRSPDDAERAAIRGAVGQVFSSVHWSPTGRIGLRLCAYARAKVMAVAVPPWEGWRPSWDARFDPGTLVVRHNVRDPMVSAPLLTLADAYLGGAMAPAEGTTAHCDHCKTEQPRNAQQPDCPKCGGPLRLSAAVTSPSPRAAVKDSSAGLGKLLQPLELCDMDDLWIEIRDTGMPPRPSRKAEYEAWRQDFLCHVELTLVVTRPVDP